MKRIRKFLFSRYAISALVILWEIALIVHLIFDATRLFFYTAAGAALIIQIIAVASIINRDANPEYKVTWTVVVLCLPILGAFLYAVLYRRRITKREERLLRGIFYEINNYRSDTASVRDLWHKDPLAAGKAAAIMSDDPISELYSGTESVYFGSGEEYFKSLIEELRSAKKFIFLEYFIIDRGRLWNEILDILTAKAALGVEVRVLYDDIGCMQTLPEGYEKHLRKMGISACRFSPVSPRMSSVHNNRDHRKICVIDGRVGYTGGVNIADEYVNLKEKYGHWKDGGIMLRGEAVKGLVREFLAGWDLTAKGISDYERYISSGESLSTGDGGYYLPFGSGPYPIFQRPSGKNCFLNLINQANSYIYITTPYLIIDYELTEALCNAVTRGVDVRIITPGIPDKKKIKIMTQSSYPHLIKSGVRIFEYSPGFVHEKCFASDDKYAVIGSINFDYRSLAHNFENAVWIYDSPTVLSVRDEFMRTESLCIRVDENNCELRFKDRLIRNAIRLFAPLL